MCAYECVNVSERERERERKAYEEHLQLQVVHFTYMYFVAIELASPLSLTPQCNA